MDAPATCAATTSPPPGVSGPSLGRERHQPCSHHEVERFLPEPVRMPSLLIPSLVLNYSLNSICQGKAAAHGWTASRKGFREGGERRAVFRL